MLKNFYTPTYLHLIGEQKALQRMINETSPKDVLDRGNLTVRLEEIHYRIAQLNEVSLNFNAELG